MWCNDGMKNGSRRALSLSLMFALFLLPAAPRTLYAQIERQLEPPPPVEYGTKFFDQLRSLFGRFRDADLQRAFEAASPVPCSEFISDNGEWREVAFFNEDRRLGDWFHESLEEVKSDLSVYLFKGLCRSDKSGIQLVTKFPVRDSLDAYNERKIPLEQITVNVNAAVAASFDMRSEAYTFDLPYLYLQNDPAASQTVYSLMAQHLEDRYDPTVMNHWECKSVHAADVTFQFVICRTGIRPRSDPGGDRSRPTFGSSAYFILSDGREASTTVKLSFGGGDDSHPPDTLDVTSNSAANASSSPALRAWEPAETGGRFAELAHGEFRIRFNPKTWMGKVGASQVLMNGRMVSLLLAKDSAGADDCIWIPGSTALASRVLDPEPEKVVADSVVMNDGTKLSPPSITFEMKALEGERLGTLRCLFPRADSAGAISFDRWNAIVGDHLTLEVRP